MNHSSGFQLKTVSLSGRARLLPSRCVNHACSPNRLGRSLALPNERSFLLESGSLLRQFRVLAVLLLMTGEHLLGDERLSPEQELQTFRMADGLEATLFASEPTVRQPLTMSFDDRGRMWIIQYLQYPHPAGLKPVEVDQYLRTKYDRVPEPPPRGTPGADRITILEDTDGDGRVDRSKDFVAGLNLATGLALGHGGVFVANAPYLLFYPDRNGDDVPDGDPEVLLKGFGLDDSHALVNSLTWGPDGWLYGAQGSTVTANIKDIEFQQGIWRYHPVTRQFELFAEGGGNTWGIDFDHRGQLFAGGNTAEPLCHHVQGGYYVKGFSKHGPLHNPYTFGYFAPVKHNGLLGTALTGGFVFYNGGLFPEVYRDQCFYPNLRQNAIRWSRVEAKRSTFETHYGGDLVTSTDIGFRPVDCTIGPDGTIYAADWYDRHIAHHDFSKPNQWYMPSKDDGRIFRIVPTGTNPRPMGPLNLQKARCEELVDLLTHRNDWYVRTARQILIERRDASVHDRLKRMLAGAAPTRQKLEALWTLSGSGGLDEQQALLNLAHPDDEVRAWTVRLLGDARQVSPSVKQSFVGLARSDGSSRVRSQLAATAKRLPASECLEIVAQLMRRSEDVDDPHIPLLVWWAIENQAKSHPDRVLGLFSEPESWRLPLVRNFLIERVARRYSAESNEASLKACARLLHLAPDAAGVRIVLGAINDQLAGRRLTDVPVELRVELERLLREPADAALPVDARLLAVALRVGVTKVFDQLRSVVLNRSTAEADRLMLIAALGDANGEQPVAVLLALIGDDPAPALQSAALSALERFQDDRIPAAVLARFDQWNADVQTRAVTLLCRRANGTAALLDAVDRKLVPAERVSIDHQRLMALHRDADLKRRIEKRWGKIQAATAKQKSERIKNLMLHTRLGKGDAGRGAELFKKTCASCHKLRGEGETLGPDLTQTERKNLEVMLLNIVDPSSLVRPEYVAYVVATNDGRVLSGMLHSESAQTVTLIDAMKNKITVSRADIEELKPSEVSLMPDNLLDPLDAQQLRDLIQFLQQ